VIEDVNEEFYFY
jgi:uncharacterized protein with von Willebrand factor type A (vWA) domain